MSATKRTVLRPNAEKSVEQIDLPKWDRHGNLIKKPVPKPAPTKVEDVEAETVHVPTVQELEAIREDAYNEGFEQGYQNGMSQGQREGHEQGLKEGTDKGYQEGVISGEETGRTQALAEEQTKTDEKLAVLTAVSQQLKQQIASEQSELEDALLSLALRIARQVIQDELRLKPKHIAPVVHAAVQSLPNPDEKLTVLLNPQEKDFVAGFADSHWTLQADDSISVGGCIVKSGFSYVDYTLEHRFENAVSHFMEQLSHVDSEKLNLPLSNDFLMQTGESSEKEKKVSAEEDFEELGNDETSIESVAADEVSDQPIESAEVKTENNVDENVFLKDPESSEAPVSEVQTPTDDPTMAFEDDVQLDVENDAEHAADIQDVLEAQEFETATDSLSTTDISLDQSDDIELDEDDDRDTTD